MEAIQSRLLNQMVKNRLEHLLEMVRMVLTEQMVEMVVHQK